VPISSGSTVLFIAFPSFDAPGLIAWTQFRDSIARGLDALDPSLTDRTLARASSPERPVGIWRMLASNHREIARSARVYPSFDTARGAVTELQLTVEPLEIRTFHGPTSSTHGWAALASGRAVITCARWYETASASQEAAASSIAAFQHASVAASSARKASTARERRDAPLAVRAW